AYRTVYGTQASPQRAAEEASRLLRNPKIAPILAQAHARANAAVSHKLEITKQRIADGLAEIAWPEGAGSVPVNVRRQALMDLGKLLGHIVEKREHRIIRGLEDLSEDELAALETDVARKLQGPRATN